MITVYALRFLAGNQIYIGLTNDISRRILEHRRRQSVSTRRLTGEFHIIYTRTFNEYKEARSHEKFLKSGAGRSLLNAPGRKTS